MKRFLLEILRASYVGTAVKLDLIDFVKQNGRVTAGAVKQPH